MPGNPFYQSKEWKEIRRQAMRRDAYQCVMCGVSVRKLGASRVDHIKDMYHYPHLALVLSNLRTLCAACDNARHSEKGHKGKPEREPVGLDGLPKSWNL